MGEGEGGEGHPRQGEASVGQWKTTAVVLQRCKPHTHKQCMQVPGGVSTWITPMWSDARIHGRVGWKDRPFTRLLFVSNLVSIFSGDYFFFSLPPFCSSCATAGQTNHRLE